MKRLSTKCEDKHVKPYPWTLFIRDVDNLERRGLIETNNAERADIDDDYIVSFDQRALSDEDFQKFMRCVNRATYRIFFDNSIMITHNHDKSEVVRITMIRR